MQVLERLSKAAAIASVVAIVLLQLIAHPDITPLLQVLAAAAFVAGWTTGRSRGAMAVWTFLLVLSPAVLREVAGREGPVLDLVPLAALAAALLRAAPWSRWQLPPVWSLVIGGWALALALGWPVIVAREAGFEIDGLFNTSAITSWAVLSSAQTIGWIGSVVLIQLLALLWFDWAFAETEAAGRPPAAVHGLWIGISLASAVALVQGFVDEGFLTTAGWAGDRRATGTMLDANAFGAAAALAGPVGFVAVRAGAIGGGWPVAAAVLGINLLGAWLSASRTMLAIAVLGLAGLGWGLMQMRADHGRPGFRRGAVLTAVALALLLLLTANAGPLRRLFEMPGGRVVSDMSGARAVIAQLWVRGGYRDVARQMVREYPWTGVGIGSFHFMAADYYREISNDDGLPFDNAQNWWRQQVAELGVLGGLAPILWSILVAWTVFRRGPPERDGAASTDVARSPAVDLTLRGLLVGIGVCSLFGVPTQNAAVQFTFLGVLAWLVARGRAAAPPRAVLHTGGAILTVLAFAYAGAHLVLATGSLSETSRATRFEREYVGGGYALERDEEGTPFNWTDDDTTLVLPRRAPWLVLRFWADHPDLAQEPVGVALSAQCGSFFEAELTGPERTTLGVQVPESYRSVELRVRVSRTWSPAEHGAADRRRLGVGIVHGFADEAVGRVADRVLALPDCTPGR